MYYIFHLIPNESIVKNWGVISKKGVFDEIVFQKTQNWNVF